MLCVVGVLCVVGALCGVSVWGGGDVLCVAGVLCGVSVLGGVVVQCSLLLPLVLVCALRGQAKQPYPCTLPCGTVSQGGGELHNVFFLILLQVARPPTLQCS